MRRAWWVALLFLLPSLVLTLLVNAALTLGHGIGSPVIWIGLFVLPLVGSGGSLHQAFARGLYAIAALCLLFAAIVYLRLWTGAGGAVLEREGLLAASRWALAVGVVSAIGAFLIGRRAARAGAARTA